MTSWACPAASAASCCRASTRKRCSMRSSLGVGDVKAGEAVIDGDVAEVPVTGTIKVTFDAVAMRPILRQVLDQQGTTMTDEQLDALLKTLESFGQDVPVDESVRLVREGGTGRSARTRSRCRPRPESDRVLAPGLGPPLERRDVPGDLRAPDPDLTGAAGGPRGALPHHFCREFRLREHLHVLGNMHEVAVKVALK